MTTIPLSEYESALIAEALSYMADTMEYIATKHRKKEISALRLLATQIPQRYEAGVADDTAMQKLRNAIHE